MQGNKHYLLGITLVSDWALKLNYLSTAKTTVFRQLHRVMQGNTHYLLGIPLFNDWALRINYLSTAKTGDLVSFTE